MKQFLQLTRQYPLLVLLLLTTNAGWGQTLINESFESTTFPPTNWSNSSSGWVRSTNSARTGSASAASNGVNDALTTPLLVNPNQLSFWYRRSTNTATWELIVEVSTSLSGPWTTVKTISSVTTTYQEETTDLSSYQNIYVRFRDNRSSGTAERYIDDVVVTELLPVPNISINNESQISSGNVNQGAVNHLLSTFQVGVATATATLNQVSFMAGGNFVAGDITNFKLFTSTTNTFPGGNPLATFPATSLASGGTVTFGSLSQTCAIGDRFFWVAADVSATAIPNNTIGVPSLSTSNFTFASGSVSGTIDAGGTQTIVEVTPQIILSSPSASAANLTQGINNQAIYRFDLAVTTANATLNGVTITTAGTYSASDLTNIKCWYSADTSFDAGSDVLLSTKTTSLEAGTQVFPSFTNQLITSGTTGYIFITVDVPLNAVAGNTISMDAITTTDLSFITGNVTGTANASGTKTIINCTPTNATGLALTPGNGQIIVNWTNPVCFDEVLIVAKATTSITANPTGDGTLYNANLTFGTGDAFDSGFVVYKGTTSPQTITGLTNGTTYFVKVFTRRGTDWSSGVESSATPVLLDNSKITWINSSTASAWYTSGNWNPAKTSAQWLTTDVALFENSGSATVAGINMGTSSLSIAGIEISNLRLRALAIGNSSTTPGTLTLNGGVVNGNLNTILRNNGGFNLTLQNNVSNSSTANLIFNNSTNNNIIVDGSGDIIITSSITSASGPVTISGSGSGIVEFAGQNTYTTATNVNSSSLRLNRTGGETLPSTNTITVSTGATLRVSTNQTLNEVNLNGGTILIDEGAVLTVTTFNVIAGSLSGLGSLRVNEVLNKTTSGEFVTNGQLILTSNATSTARVAQVSGSITGNVVVERHIPAKRAWRFLTAPVTGNTNNSVYFNWQNNGAAGNNGTGVNLWSPAGGNGLVAGGGAPNIYKYKTVAPAGWDAITNTQTEALFTNTTNNAFMVFVTGGANTTNIASGATATTMAATGALRVGDVNYGNLPANIHTLIGNPYASPISPLAVLNGNPGFRDKLWVLDPQIGSVGQYVIYDKVAGYTNISGSYQAGTNIQSGQAFFVRRSSLPENTAATFTITEAHKATVSDNGVFDRNATQSITIDKLRLSLWKNQSEQAQNLDAVLAVFYDNGNNAVDMADGGKINGVGENLALMNGTSAFTLEHRATAIPQDVLPVRVSGMQEGANYQLRVQTEGFNNPNVEVFLHDTFTNTVTPIPTDDTVVTYPFTVTSATASTGNRFQVLFQNSPLGVSNPEGFSQAVVYPNPVNDGMLHIALPTATYQKVSLYNALGQVVYQQNALGTTNLLQVSTQGLANGYYQLQVEDQQGQKYQAKVIINQ